MRQDRRANRMTRREISGRHESLGAAKSSGYCQRLTVAPTPHPSPLPRERETVWFRASTALCSEAGTLASLAVVGKTQSL